jgi:hypothetical protein
MLRQRLLIVLVLFIFLIGSFGLWSSHEPVHAQQIPPSQFEIVFPGDAAFAGLDAKLREKSQLSGSAWVEEFKKQPVLARVRTTNGLEGVLFPNSLATINVLTGQAPFIVYGTIDIPAGAKLGSRDFSGEYGIVVFSEPLAIALIDLTSGSAKAFVVVALQGQSIPLLALPLTIFSPLWVFQSVASLITVGTPMPPPPPPPPTPVPAPSEPRCLEDLPNKRDVSVSLVAPSTIVTVVDSAGENLFAIAVEPPKSLKVQSFGAVVQFLYTTAQERHLGLIIGPDDLPVPLTVDRPFALFVASGTNSACLQATPKLVNGVLTLVGTLSTN